MREYVLAALQQIESDEQLSTAHYRTVRRLLDRVGANGELHLDRDEAMALCGATATGTMRAHLIALQNAGILIYNINCQIHIGFLAWPAVEIRANSRENSELDPVFEPDAELTRASCARYRAQDARNRANLADFGGDKGGVGWDLDLPIPLEITDQPTNQPAPVLAQPEPETATAVPAQPQSLPATTQPVQPTPEPATDPQSGAHLGSRNPQSAICNPGSPVEQALSLALLVAAGVIARNAKRLAVEQPFERVQRATAHWYAGKGSRFEETPGIVVSWLDDWANAGIPLALSPAFLRSDLYRRHRTRAQIAADTAAGAAYSIPAPPRPALRPLPPPPDELTALWSYIVAAYPESAQLYLRQAHLVSLAGGVAQVVATPPVLPWLRTQLSRRLVRDFALREQPVTAVVFAPPVEEEVAYAGSTP